MKTKFKKRRISQNATRSALLINDQSRIEAVTYLQSLRFIQRQLSVFNWLLSRLIHAPVISELSYIISNVLVRPTAVLIGGLAACTISIVMFILSYTYGYFYNFEIAIQFYVFGYIIGLAIELIVLRFNKYPQD